MKDIARELGISVATVSRALKDSPSISKERRELIQRYAREHDFTPNVLAMGLRHTNVHPQKIIGVIIPQFAHYYFSTILSGIETEASLRGYRIIAAQSNELYEREVSLCQSFLKHRVCGVIVSQARDTHRYEHFEKLRSNGIPLVFYDRISTGINAPRVVVDDYAGAKNAVSHLISTGCRRIAFYGTKSNMEIVKNRYNGYCDALREAGISVDEALVQNCSCRSEAEDVTPSLFADDAAAPDAFFCINDSTAIGVLHAVKRMGKRVPEDVSICGFSNDNFSLACDPLLTTVEQRGVEVGRNAVDILVSQVEGLIPPDKVEKRIVRTNLIVRGTTREDGN